jgi:hypothetical protein
MYEMDMTLNVNNNNNNNNNKKHAKRSHFRNLPSHKEVYVPVMAIEI